MSRFWSAEQIELAKTLRATKSAAEIAELVGRTRTSVSQLFQRLELVKRHKARPELIALIQDRHPLGWTDAEITREWCRIHPEDPLDRRWIQEVRRDKLGLPSNALSEHRRLQVAQRTREQLAAAGLNSLAEVRCQAYADFGARQGWPGVTRPRAVQILNLLYERGPHTRRQICEAIGMPWKGSRKSLCSNDPEGSYLANLVARGLVVQLPRMVKGQGSGTSCYLYAIAANVHRETISTNTKEKEVV